MAGNEPKPLKPGQPIGGGAVGDANVERVDDEEDERHYRHHRKVRDSEHRLIHEEFRGKDGKLTKVVNYVYDNEGKLVYTVTFDFTQSPVSVTVQPHP